MTKIVFLHGFFASGSCVPALALKEAFQGKAQVLSPDMPLHPQVALDFVFSICQKECPQLLVGNSCGSFFAQIVASVMGIPALLGNPYFEMTHFLLPRKGPQQYKAPRRDGCQNFVIDDALINEFAQLQATQFDHCTAVGKEHIWGLFGVNDTLAHYESLFLQHYTHAYHFPGGHTPTAEEVKAYYAPLAQKLLNVEL